MNLQKRNKIIAREVLLFFLAITIIGLTWCFLIARNQYFKSKLIYRTEERSSLKVQIENLPPDKINALYDGLKSYFVVNYVVGSDSYSLPKYEEFAFLYDYPNAKLVSGTSIGYSYSRGNIYNGKSVDNENLLPLPPPKLIFDSVAVFDFVSLKKFRVLLRNETYRKLLYNAFSNQFDLGTKKSFESKMINGLKSDYEFGVKTNNLLMSKQNTDIDIVYYKAKILNKQGVAEIVLRVCLIIIILLYLIRFSIILIRWAILTIRNP